MDAQTRSASDQEPDFLALSTELHRFETLIEHWEEAQKAVAFGYRDAIDNVNGAALRKLIRELKDHPQAAEALRKAAADPLVYGVLRHHGLVRPSQQERIERALASVRPSLASHGGDVELVGFTPPDTIELRFLGNCDGCSASALTFVAGVKRAIEEYCPEITRIRQVKGTALQDSAPSRFVSPFVETGIWSTVLDFGSIRDGDIATVTIDGKPLLLARIGHIVVCYHDSCAHLGLPISSGTVADGTIRCPNHGFQYHLLTGECLTAAEVQLRPVPARVVDGRVEVRLGN